MGRSNGDHNGEEVFRRITLKLGPFIRGSREGPGGRHRIKNDSIRSRQTRDNSNRAKRFRVN